MLLRRCLNLGTIQERQRTKQNTTFYRAHWQNEKAGERQVRVGIGGQTSRGPAARRADGVDVLEGTADVPCFSSESN